MIFEARSTTVLERAVCKSNFLSKKTCVFESTEYIF